VDEPLNLYDYPINQFVAGFIGTPQMNFFDAVLTGTKNKVYVEFGEDKVLLPKEKVALICNLEDYLNTGKPVIFGIRPENIKADPAIISANKESTISVNVEFIEGLGAETLLYCKTKDIVESDDIIEVKSNLTAKVENRTLAKAGDTIELALDLTRCHLFDKETEITLVARTEDGKAELEAMQAARVEEERIKAEERAAKEAEEAAKLAAKLAKKNAMLKKFGLGKKDAPVEEIAEEVVEEPAEEPKDAE
jgi:multiple sugar transport system ATP-binding protein